MAITSRAVCVASPEPEAAATASGLVARVRTNATRLATWLSLSSGEAGMALPGTPARMASLIWASLRSACQAKEATSGGRRVSARE
jgi:hypothetical protein